MLVGSPPSPPAIPSPSASPSAFVGTCDPIYRGIAPIAIDPGTPIVVAYPQSFVVVLRAQVSAGSAWSLAQIDPAPVPGPDGHAYAFATVDRAFEVEPPITIDDNAYDPAPAGGVPVVGAPADQFFRFRVLASAAAADPNAPLNLTFVLTDPARKTLRLKIFTVRIAQNRTTC